jgi:eukaryotic-like serine/threonine-protein kinase
VRSWQSNSRVRWARNVAVPEIQRLADQADYDGAYRLAREAMAVLPDDPQLKQIWIDATFEVTIETNPPGADVALKGYRADAADWIAMGRTPLTNVRVPNGPLRVRITKEGMVPVESESFALFKYTLDPLTALVPGMVRVGAATASVGTTSVPVKDFWIDKREVTNRDFKLFVDQGGYRSREYWKEAFVDRGRTRSWEEAMTAFRDTTGRPGPSTWELGTYPEGQADIPVSGVSWYEAAAYAAFVGKRLPTAFHWRAAAGFNSPVENFADIVLVSNFSGKGSAPVGSYRGLGPFGTYDMAGNVKEWCWSESAGGRRLILGGGWNETSYMFHDFDAQPPFQRSEAYGIRLMQEIEPSVPEVTAPIPTLAPDLTKEMPADAATFEIIRNLYAYDYTPLNVTLEGVEDAAAWRKETVSYDAPYGKERIRTYFICQRTRRHPIRPYCTFQGATHSCSDRAGICRCTMWTS